MFERVGKYGDEKIRNILATADRIELLVSLAPTCNPIRDARLCLQRKIENDLRIRRKFSDSIESARRYGCGKEKREKRTVRKKRNGKVYRSDFGVHGDICQSDFYNGARDESRNNLVPRHSRLETPLNSSVYRLHPVFPIPWTRAIDEKYIYLLLQRFPFDLEIFLYTWRQLLVARKTNTKFFN